MSLRDGVRRRSCSPSMAPPPELGRGVKWEHTTHLAPGAAMRSPFEVVAAARRHPSKHALGALLRTLARSTHVAGCRDYRLLDGDRVMADVLDIRRPEHTGVRACVRASTHERVGSHRAQIARYSTRRCGAPSTALSTSRRVWLALHRLAPIHDSTNILSASPCVSPCIASRRRCN